MRLPRAERAAARGRGPLAFGLTLTVEFPPRANAAGQDAAGDQPETVSEVPDRRRSVPGNREVAGALLAPAARLSAPGGLDSPRLGATEKAVASEGSSAKGGETSTQEAIYGELASEGSGSSSSSREDRTTSGDPPPPSQGVELAALGGERGKAPAVSSSVLGGADERGPCQTGNVASTGGVPAAESEGKGTDRRGEIQDLLREIKKRKMLPKCRCTLLELQEFHAQQHCTLQKRLSDARKVYSENQKLRPQFLSRDPSLFPTGPSAAGNGESQLASSNPESSCGSSLVDTGAETCAEEIASGSATKPSLQGPPASTTLGTNAVTPSGAPSGLRFNREGPGAKGGLKRFEEDILDSNGKRVFSLATLEKLRRRNSQRGILSLSRRLTHLVRTCKDSVARGVATMLFSNIMCDSCDIEPLGSILVQQLCLSRRMYTPQPTPSAGGAGASVRGSSCSVASMKSCNGSVLSVFLCGAAYSSFAGVIADADTGVIADVDTDRTDDLRTNMLSVLWEGLGAAAAKAEANAKANAGRNAAGPKERGPRSQADDDDCDGGSKQADRFSTRQKSVTPSERRGTIPTARVENCDGAGSDDRSGQLSRTLIEPQADSTIGATENTQLTRRGGYRLIGATDMCLQTKRNVARASIETFMVLAEAQALISGLRATLFRTRGLLSLGVNSLTGSHHALASRDQQTNVASFVLNFLNDAAEYWEAQEDVPLNTAEANSVGDEDSCSSGWRVHRRLPVSRAYESDDSGDDEAVVTTGEDVSTNRLA